MVDLYARWKKDAINLQPDIISILIGVNDTWHEKAEQNGVEVPRYEEFYRRLLSWTRETLPAVRFVLLEPFVLQFDPEWVPEIDARRAVVKRIAAECDATFVPLQERFRECCRLAAPEYWLVDGVHPTPAGHQVIADAWLQIAGKLL